MITKGRLISGIRSASGIPSAWEPSIDMPVTPPSMKWLESKKPSMPIPAESTPRSIRILFLNSTIKFFIYAGYNQFSTLEETTGKSTARLGGKEC
jgi:hypothetical protein